jgi:hypothetical protein
MTEEEYKTKVYDKVSENHIWLNAFACINPSSEFCEKLGRDIIQMLKEKDRLIHSYYGDSEVLKTLAELTPILYLRINKS